MTREQQITQASQGRFPEWGEQQHAFELAFQAGCHWADSHPHWISVEDALPTDSEEVLIYGFHTDEAQKEFEEWMKEKRPKYFFAIDHYETGNKFNDWFNILCVTACYRKPKPAIFTHWMPLPAPPEHLADVSKKISSSEKPNNCKKGEQSNG